MIQACPFDPMVNRSYTGMAPLRHGGAPSAAEKAAREKAKVDVCVGIVERWVLGRLRNRIFSSPAEVNTEVAECIADFNETRVLRRFSKPRASCSKRSTRRTSSRCRSHRGSMLSGRVAGSGSIITLLSSITITRCLGASPAARSRPASRHAPSKSSSMVKASTKRNRRSFGQNLGAVEQPAP